MLCDRCHEDIVGDGWDGWDGEEIDRRPEYGPRTAQQQYLTEQMLKALKPMFRFREFTKE